MVGISTLAFLTALATANAQLGQPIFEEKQFSQQFYDNYNLLKHIGGNGPYSDSEGYGINRDAPASCEVSQVIMLHRHGERYPDPSVAQGMVGSFKKLKASNKTLVGSLAFANSWETFLDNPDIWAEETVSGPYSGLLNGFHRGVVYRSRYGHLWNGENVPIFSSGYERIVETARRFGEGFFGYNYSTNAYVNIIPEVADQGANSLTPTCFTGNDSPTPNLNNLTQFAVAAERLNRENVGLNLTVSDIYNLMLLAPFELNGRPFSPWFNVFTLEEWITFGYYNDLNYFYGTGGGPGANISLPIGSVYANATLSLLNDPNAGKLFFSFCHDTNITPVLVALGLFVPKNDLPLDHVDFHSIYKSGNFVPMGGHLVLERLECNATSQFPKGTYVRTVVNEAVIPRENCQNGPGFSCPLKDYTNIVQNLTVDYVTECQVPPEYPQYLSFFWNYNQSTALNYHKGDIQAQTGLITWDDQPIE
ncbi:acid phosphatase PHO11 [Sugiyamaella lignohabitans]|uniref:Acid phosphatase PHO11 n=1 Tax=Sugiyamaella lignohabitans TaxID=796027 RepID=A0A167DEV5_9ASCO|nr:acid phosphatase PHO11 [Sugiyamaella lignohabitans]ANB12835.1 acid phosphatase PHO11 [Sugiyamaella lignohabitans]